VALNDGAGALVCHCGITENDTSIHAAELRLRRLIRASRLLNKVCVESGNCLFQQVG
jgi:hypothetical protein